MKRLILAIWLFAGAVFALEPSEMLSDPVLESRARALDHEIRCVKCQSESLASSNADWAQDARRQIRELIEGGASDQEVKDWFLARYGEFVLMNPAKTGSTLALWLAGPAMLLIAAIMAWSYVRMRSEKPESSTDSLSADEEARLREILKD